MRRVLAVLVLALALAGCEVSNLDGAAPVVVSGRVLAADGSPAGGVPVALERDPTLGEAVAGLFLIPLSFGTVCLADPPAPLCRGRTVRRATTAADGSYTINLTGRDTQTGFGNAAPFTLSSQVGGSVVTADFRIQAEALRLPDLQAWAPAVSVASGRIGWGPPAPGEYQVVVEDTAGRRVWSFEAERPEVSFDPRLLEDTAGSLAVAARTRTTAEGTTVVVRRQSPPAAYRGGAGPPLSRGRPCVVAPAGTALAPCPLTDGDLRSMLPPAPAPARGSDAVPTTAPAANQVTIDLGRLAEVSLVVVRGCTCTVDRSADGQAWTEVGRVSGFAAVAPARPGPARFVRLTGIYGEAGEVSVWEGRAPAAGPPTTLAPGAPAPAAPPAVTPPAAGGAGGQAAPAATPPDEPRTGPALVALALLVMAGAGTGAAAARRR